MAENTPEQPVPQSGDKPKEDIRKARIISVEVKDSTDEEKENMKKTEEVLQRKIKKESQKPKIDLPEETPESKDIKKARIISPEQQTALRPESKKNNIELKGPLSNAIKEAAEEILGKKLPKDAQEKPIASKPEQQQSSESENNPADDGLDIDAAREFLNKAYGPEESSVAVGAENTEKFFKTEIISGPTSYPEKPVKQPVKNNDDFHLTPAELENIDKQKNVREAQEETKENSVIEAGETKIVGMETKIETLKAEPAVEEIKERVKKEKEEQGTQVENAKNELVNLAESITVAREKKETETETSLYNQAKEVFEVATGENLEKISKEKAKTEAEKEGLKVSTPEEYRKQKTTEIQERIQQKERSAIIKERWDMLSDKEKEKYFFGAENKNDPAVIISARIKFATELKGKIDAKRQELSKGKKGISISEDVFYELMRKGFKSEDIKKRGFLGRMFFGNGIKMPPLDKTDERGFLTKKIEYLTGIETKVKKGIADSAQEEVERKIIEGQKRWRERKQRHTREIIQETALKFKSEKTKEKLKIKPEEERSSEITEGLKSFEKIGDIEKIMKKVDSDIKAKKEQQKKMMELKKKIKQGRILNSKEKAFLNKVDYTYRKGAEK